MAQAEQERLMILLASPFKAKRVESVAPTGVRVISVDPLVEEERCKVEGDAATVSREKALYKLSTALQGEGRYLIAGKVLERTGLNLFSWPGEVIMAANDVVQGDLDGWVYEKPKDMNGWLESVENLADRDMNIVGTWVSVPFRDETKLNYVTYDVSVKTKPFNREEIERKLNTDQVFRESVLKVASGLGLEHSGLYEGPFGAEAKVNSHGPTFSYMNGNNIEDTGSLERRSLIYGAHPALFDTLFDLQWSVDTMPGPRETTPPASVNPVA